MGAVFTVAALICWLSGARTASLVLLAVLLVPATLEAVFGYCIGCRVFAILMRLGVIPEAICLECADIYGPRAGAARAAAAASRPRS
jgi:hypothetical protein